MARRRGYQSNRKNVNKALTGGQKLALEAIGAYVQGEAILRTPVGQYDDGRVGGRLRDSIDYKVDESSGSVQVGTNVEYAPYVEKGTYKMASQPYLTPAVEENTSNIQKVAETHMKLKE